MTRAAARITPELLETIVRLDDPDQPLAEVARRVAAEAERRGLTRPSYEWLRRLIHETRAARNRGPSALRIFLEDGASMRVGRRTLEEMLLPRDERRRRR